MSRLISVAWVQSALHQMMSFEISMIFWCLQMKIFVFCFFCTFTPMSETLPGSIFEKNFFLRMWSLMTKHALHSSLKNFNWFFFEGEAQQNFFYFLVEEATSNRMKNFLVEEATSLVSEMCYCIFLFDKTYYWFLCVPNASLKIILWKTMTYTFSNSMYD